MPAAIQDIFLYPSMGVRVSGGDFFRISISKLDYRNLLTNSVCRGTDAEF
jgi:hypothetical protein